MESILLTVSSLYHAARWNRRLSRMTNTNDLLGRRELLRTSLLGAGALLLTSGASLLAADKTPAQDEGPFHPTQGSVDLRVLKYLDKNTDLTVVDGQTGKATGTVL